MNGLTILLVGSPAFHFVGNVIDFLSHLLNFCSGLFFCSILFSIQYYVFQIGGDSTLVNFNHLQRNPKIPLLTNSCYMRGKKNTNIG